MPEAASHVRWLSSALDDLVRLHAFLAPHGVELADQAIQAIAQAADSLTTLPLRWRAIPVKDRVLTVPFGQLAYLVRYRVVAGLVWIARVKHSKESRSG